MMRPEKYTEEEARVLAHRSLDEGLTPEELNALQEVFKQYPGLAEEVTELKAMQQLFTQLSPAAKPAFAQRVIQKVTPQAIWYRPLIKNWSSIAAAACVALLLAVGFIYGNSGSLEAEALLGLEEIHLEDAYAFE